MKITIVTGPFFSVPPAPCGAVERLWHDLAQQFVRRGHVVTVLCRTYPGQAPRQTIDGITYFRRTQFNRSGNILLDMAYDLVYSMWMFFLLPRADVLVTNVFWLPALARHLRPDAGKLVVNVHRFPKGQIRLYSSAARIATVSRTVRDAIVAQYPRAAPQVRVFPNPINVHVFVPPQAQRVPQPLVLYTGRVHPEKGLHLLVDACVQLRREFPACRLRIVGPWEVTQGGGGDAYLQDLRRRAGDLPVEFAGPIYDRAKLAEALQSAYVYCYPSLAERGESFGIAPVEAMATGLVPVLSNLQCFTEYLEDGVNGYVFDHRGPDAAANLAQALRKILADPVRTARMSHQAARRAADFSNERVAQLYLEDFQELVGPKTAAEHAAAALTPA